MPSTSHTSAGHGAHPPVPQEASADAGLLSRLSLRFTAWAERWFPDAFVFAAIAVVVVAGAAVLNGSSPQAVAKSFGDGFWSLIVFTMQMALVGIGGVVVGGAPPPPGRPPPPR